MCHGKDGSNIQLFKLKRISLIKCNREELLGFLDSWSWGLKKDELEE